ncbi:DNA-binding transcriptional LysR family regulator [Rhodococcus sp. PvR044]|jgi:DNA-binding transcriptional LysR family regulator|uniref:LysR family transcriptional regulator n=1 Tax=Rhodococcus TaxID=1827 RepID=UPI000BD863EE|nr:MULTISPECIES: LysR family transcriptional regulator [Rhodococcus]MBP1158698.1 DNA-binding transcriptional LysR family regulator [Rhodococcus sp. PvR099]MCZ4558445.1 LysR family transcriptional regulator [Rhodococcus maanshanensis]PTR45448.1 DNA-binding transcriptional LysR family regulator [Rhodococcus sp. OK611]SNX88998.1 DNA-binding transcriptional regulator, LysR family [Rhodococcus sp. OK270]
MDRFLSDEVAAAIPLFAAFDTAAREGHITRAADVLGVPQSSLSRRLKSLEQTLGVPLFQQVGRGVSLTTAGRELHERTRDLVWALDDAVSAVKGNADPDSGLVRFGFPLTLGPVSIPSLLAGFHRVAPRIRLHLVQAHGEALSEMVRDGRLDLAVIIPPPDDLPVTVLGRQRILLHVARTHPLAGRSQVELAELVEEHFIASPPTYHLRQRLDSWCARAGFTPHVAFEISEFETIRVLVGHGLGIALLPAAETSHPDLVGITLSGVGDRTIGLVTGNQRPSAAVTRLHDHVTGHAGEFITNATR